MLGLLALAVDAQAESKNLYTRATPVEAHTGIVHVRTVQEALVVVPIDCAGARPLSFGCTSTQRFARVYGLTFILERREARAEIAQVKQEARGQIYLFLYLDRSDLDAFDEELRRELSNVTADAYVDDYAGFMAGSAVFSRLARVSRESSWSCFEHGSRRTTEYKLETVEEPDGRTRSVPSQAIHFQGPAVDPLCVTGPTLVGAVRPEEIRTMPSVRALREEMVLADIVDPFPQVATAEDLLPLPETFSYTVRRRPGFRSEAHYRQDAKGKASLIRDEREIAAEVVPAVFPPNLIATRGWLARWTIETIDRELGAQPSATVRQPVVLRSALVATQPPTPLDADGRPLAQQPKTVEPRFDTTAYLAEIAHRLERAVRVDADGLADAIARGPAGPGSDGFVLFLCRERGATFELVPTRASADVVNAGEICAAIDRALVRGDIE